MNYSANEIATMLNLLVSDETITDKAKYYHCLARLLELNIMTHKVEEIL